MTGASGDHVQSLARGLAVIRAFDVDRPRQTVSEVALRTELSRPAARRFLLTLHDLGYVGTDGTAFWLTPRVLDLGYSYLSSLSLPEVAGPHLEALAARVHESASVSILDGDDVVYVARVPVSRIMTVSITIGTRFPAYATSMGRVLLAALGDSDLSEHLDRVTPQPLTAHTKTATADLRESIRAAGEQGFCIVDGELEAGLRSLAAPIHGRDGSVIAAVNISTQSVRYSLEGIRDDLLPELLRTATAITADIARTTH
ncbi:MAG: IclR family transcriptional regulator [Gordonia sp.]|jgi:IclR family pca regulon transcriptional regulator|uniref:Helix-turn-helix domain-containing protein n=1 Tax=Gordonia rubripertincta TaxID=36822 RepID=A0ABT4MZB0_GORRU|nr:IclR family transcriptional regulator C-terminal domain-containing protein [Gordonia rubripertincta]MBA4021588.1 IclR family transcriptional regulator [Gordonia sp. (in: high G+C Gram-positive bacteria)]MCZ4552349.1 helix-turn-helix domain-containing protein [Gordonia rubripertincta]